ncbi:hypothetical protein B0F90DRAFT_1705259 [Multifurca ochricompacta]|uniref:Uncharacterized protein n=1 Tax=Multifurca ochricompacta TaxID=376703 RepID=A0AAD4M7L6_9AGAM|nr:hypothetical protein B0F90DRAFT_1705259 [Multifurca ochricompacta]
MRAWDEAVDGPSPSIVSTSRSSLRFHYATVQPVSLSLPYFQSPIYAQLPLHGRHQLDNLGVATSIISSLLTHSYSIHRLPFQRRITPSTIAAGVRSTSWAGRLSFHHVPLSRLRDQEGLKLTFILALSHSPPKMPLQTLSPLLSFKRPREMEISVSAAAIEFTPVEGMPWVQPVPSSEIREAIKNIDGNIKLWVPGEGERLSVDNALLWTYERQRGKGLVCLAGSLYLVADFYRFLNK